MTQGDSLRDRICFQLFITSGAKVSRERPGSFVLLMAQTVSSVTGREGGRGPFAALEPGNCKSQFMGSTEAQLLTTETFIWAEERSGMTSLHRGNRKCCGAAEPNG